MFWEYLAEVPLMVLLVMVLACGYVAFSILVFWPSPRYATRVEQAAQARPSNTKWLSKAASALDLRQQEARWCANTEPASLQQVKVRSEPSSSYSSSVP